MLLNTFWVVGVTTTEKCTLIRVIFVLVIAYFTGLIYLIFLLRIDEASIDP